LTGHSFISQPITGESPPEMDIVEPRDATSTA
jgi:hypothetical protein